MNSYIKTETCPVTGLEIISVKRWEHLKVTDNYMVTFRKIGDRIVDVVVYGNIGEFDADRYQQLLDKFIEDQHVKSPFIEMRNYDDLVGIMPSKRSLMKQKTYFIENKDKRIGFVAYNASKAIGLILESGQRQYKKINVALKVAPDYKRAVLTALKILEQYSPTKVIKEKKKHYRISSEDIEKVASSCGRFLWEDNDLFDVENLAIDADHPLFPIVENFAIVREELIHLENESFRKSEALESEKIQTEKIVESLQSGIMIIDPTKDQVVDINPAACELIQSTKEKIIGKPFAEFLVDREKVFHENSKECYLRNTHEEMIPVMRSSVQVRLNNKSYILENFVDITEAKAHEDRLRESLAHTQQMNSMTLNREKRIIEMKKEVNSLLKALGQEVKYKSVIDTE